MIRRTAVAALALAVGYAAAGLLFWALLNVPESNARSLALSAALVIAMVAALGIFTAASAALGDGMDAAGSARRSFASLPAFLVGLLLFAALWWLTTAVDGWWLAHTGEIDATMIRYTGIARTAWLHQAVFWTTWIVRWVVGLSAIVALATTATISGRRAIASGLRRAAHPLTLLAVAAAITLVWGVLWRAVYWRPARIPTVLEPTFVIAKLTLLYLLAATIAATALSLCRRSARAGSPI